MFGNPYSSTTRVCCSNSELIEETKVCAASGRSLHNLIFTCPEGTGRVKITRMSSVGGQGGQIRALKLHGALKLQLDSSSPCAVVASSALPLEVCLALHGAYWASRPKAQTFPDPSSSRSLPASLEWPQACGRGAARPLVRRLRAAALACRWRSAARPPVRCLRAAAPAAAALVRETRQASRSAEGEPGLCGAQRRADRVRHAVQGHARPVGSGITGCGAVVPGCPRIPHAGQTWLAHPRGSAYQCPSRGLCAGTPSSLRGCASSWPLEGRSSRARASAAAPAAAEAAGAPRPWCLSRRNGPCTLEPMECDRPQSQRGKFQVKVVSSSRSKVGPQGIF